MCRRLLARGGLAAGVAGLRAGVGLRRGLRRGLGLRLRAVAHDELDRGALGLGAESR